MASVKKVTRNMEKMSVSELCYYPLHMELIKKTEMYIKFAKVMVILQGPYCDERKKLLENVKRKFPHCSRILSDESYKKETGNLCSYEKTEEYYAYFLKASRIALEEGNNLLVIDCTMSNTIQNAKYFALAYKMQYVVLVTPPVVMQGMERPNWPGKSQALSFQKAGTFIQASNMFQHLFCGWFLHDSDSHELRHESSLYVMDCINDIPEFRLFVKQLTKSYNTEDDSTLKESDEEDEKPKLTLIEAFRQHFNMLDKWQDLACCVVKVFDDVFRGMNEYYKKEAVIKNYGKMSKLYVIGFIVTPYMIAARIKLTKEQRELWDRSDEIREDAPQFPPCPSEQLQQLKASLPEFEVKLISSKCNRTLINSGSSVSEPENSIPPYFQGKSCHIVLGKAPGVPAKHVDWEVAMALQRESHCARIKADITIENLSMCLVKRLGKYWFIYLKDHLIVDGFFASCSKPYEFEQGLDAF